MMKRLLLSSILGVLPVCALAQTDQGLRSVRVSPDLRIELPSKIHQVWPEDFDKYRRTYDLSNGQTMTMEMEPGPGVRKMYAKVSDGPPTEIVAASPSVFVALNKRLKITLDPASLAERRGEVLRGELLMVVPERAARQGNAQHVEVLSLALGR
jgi:hypothetical protein